MITRLFVAYGVFHKDRRNIVCHEIGIPMIVLGTFALLELIRIGPVDLAMVAGVLVLNYYVTLSPPLAVAAIFGFALFYWIGRSVAWPLAVGFLFAGLAPQFLGHYFKRRNFAILANPAHLLVVPLWICWVVAGDKRDSEA